MRNGRRTKASPFSAVFDICGSFKTSVLNE
jgi:hypothetical protein